MKRTVVKARAFELVDDEGNVRARLGLGNDDSPFLSLHDPDGRVRARFGLDTSGAAGLAIGDEEGKVRATLGLATDGSSSLALGDKNGKIRAKFGLAAPHVPRPAASLSPGERTRAALALLQARGVNLLVLDEPTNHLDLPAIEQLESALESYDGTLLLVTHDRRMLDTVRTTRRWTVVDGTVAESS